MRGQPNGLHEATDALADFVDHFPLDQEAWQELASLYLQQNKYAQAAYALEELVLLAPHNSFYLLMYAETLYTMGDWAKAYKIYLRILELGQGNLKREDSRHTDRVSGPWVRTLWGLKMVSTIALTQCAAQLLAHKDKQSDGDAVAEKIPAIDAMATELLLNNVYAAGASDPAPPAVRAAARSCLANMPP